MIRLNQTASQLLSLITTQNGANVVVSYSDKTTTSYNGNTQVTNVVSATTTTICDTPAASTIRDIDHISIKNTFAGSHTITVQVSSSATLYPIFQVALLTNEVAEYTHGSGWRCFDANGNLKTTPLTAMTSAQLAAILTDETGTGSAVFATSPTLVTPTLGVASATSLQTSGMVGIGGAPIAYNGLRLGAGAITLTGNTSQSANSINCIFDSTCTTANGVVNINSANGATITNYAAFTANPITLTGGATVSQANCFYVPASFGGGATNIGFFGGLTSAANVWNCYVPGTANNAFAGNSRFGGVTAPVATVDITGSLAATTTILSSGATSGIGYTTGAGGTVTQATSRTTGVTLNKVTGAITLVSAAGSTTPSTFTVTNSAVAATDNIIVQQKSGTDLYNIHVTAIAAGSFNITFWTTGGTTTEQPVFNFSVIKGVTA